MAPHFTPSDSLRPDLPADKAVMRRDARRRRRAYPDRGQALGDVLVHHLGCLGGTVIAGYWRTGGEIDVVPALLAFAAAGSRIALPCIVAPDAPLQFIAWHPGTPTVPGPYGTRTAVGEPVAPGVLLVPLLAFDRFGRRLGQGGGYYDRTLAAMPGALALGCAYAAQQVDRVPAGPHDVRLHAIATERGVIIAAPHQE